MSAVLAAPVLQTVAGLRHWPAAEAEARSLELCGAVTLALGALEEAS